MIKLLKKNPDNFLLFFEAHICWHFMSHTIQPMLFRVVYPTLFDLNHPSFAKSRYPVFIGSISTPPKPQFYFQNGIPNVVSGSSTNVLELQINPTLTPSPSCIPSTLVAHSHACFYFLNSLLYLFSKYRNIYVHIFSHDSYLPPFFLKSITYPPPPLNYTHYFCS